MMQLDVHIDPETLFLVLEEQLKKLPVKLSRITGKNQEFLGLSITKPETAPDPSHIQKTSESDIKNCHVTTEERFHLFNDACSGS